MAPRRDTPTLPQIDGNGGRSPVTRRLLVALLSGSTMLSVAPAGARAQTAAPAGAATELEAITVTGQGGTGIGPDDSIVAKSSRAASKTDTPLLDTPASVSVVTEQELKTRGVTTFDEALSYTPGVATDIYGSDNRYDHYMIRGFYSSGLSTFRDGLPVRINNFTGSRMEPYGLQRLEILKGANSTLFGISQPGGIVNAVSKRPQDTAFGEVYTTLGNDHVETGTDFGGPLDQDGLWSYRLTSKWQDAEQGIDESRDDRVYIAPALTFSPSAETDFTLLTSYNKRNGSTSHGIPFGSGIDSDTYLGEPDYDRMDTIERNIGYEFRHDFGNGLEFRQNARYTNLDALYQSTFASSIALGGVEGRRDALGIDGNSKRFDLDNQLEYEASAGVFDSRTLFGVSYQHDKLRESRVDGTLPGIDITDPAYVGIGAITFGPPAVTNGSQTTQSVYLQEQLTVNERWILTLGGRYDHVDTASETAAYAFDAQTTDEAFTTRAGLTYKATDEVSLFANYAESFQPMGVNRVGLIGEPEPQEGLQYEIGAKYQPEGTDALFTVALFDLTQKNISQYTPDFSAQYQIGEVNVRGIELEGKIALTERMNLTAAYSYWDAEIKDDTNPINVGKRPDRVPAHLASLWADYTIPGNHPRGDITLGLGARFVGRIYGDDANTIRLPSRTVLDAALSYKVAQNATLAVNATNLFDREYISDVDTFSNTAYYGDRRTVKATLRYTW